MSETSPDIFRVLRLSTSHLKRETAEALDNGTDPDVTTWGQCIPYGYWVWSGWGVQEEDASIPEEVLAACSVARTLGCEYLKYDCDAARCQLMAEHVYDW